LEIPSWWANISFAPHFTNRKGEARFTAMAFECMESRIKTSVNYEQII